MIAWIAIAGIAHGVLLGGVAIYFAIRTRRFLAQSVRTDALVVDTLVRQSSPHDSSDAMRMTTLRPVVEFDDQDGQKQRVEISLGMTHPS